MSSSGSLAERTNGFSECNGHTHKHKEIEYAVLVQRVGTCSILDTTRVLFNDRGSCMGSEIQLYAGNAVARMVEGDLSGKPRWNSLSSQKGQVWGRNKN